MHSCVLAACGKAHPEGYEGFCARVGITLRLWLHALGCAASGFGKLVLAGPWVWPDLMAPALCLAAY